MAAPTSDIQLVELLDKLGQVNTPEMLLAWASEEVGRTLPHRAFLCGLGRKHHSSVSPVKVFASNVPADFLRALKKTDGICLSEALRKWLGGGDALLLETAEMEGAGFDGEWLKSFKASGLQNIASHGVYDLPGQYLTWFSFHQVAEPFGAHFRRLLGLLAPAVHVALLRIVQKLKADANATRTDRTLTARELEVLVWVCEGKTSAEISDILGVARNTVRNQIQSILVKLRVNTRAQAAAKAIKKGLVVPRQPDSQFGPF